LEAVFSNRSVSIPVQNVHSAGAAGTCSILTDDRNAAVSGELLQPSIQSEIAGLEAVDGVEPMSERPLRVVLRRVGWRGQERVWTSVR